MTTYELGVNTCFAVKRWPEPERWARLVRDDLGLGLVQHSLDLVDLDGPHRSVDRQARAVRVACEDHGLRLHSTFTGLAAYSGNLLLDPDDTRRTEAEAWYRRAIAFTARVGGGSTGGHVGAFSVSDWRDPARRSALEDSLTDALRRLAAAARAEGLDALLVENLASAREPSTMEQIENLLTLGDEDHAPIALCLDVGHQCVPGTEGDERDPYVWLERLGARAPVVQLQQTDAGGDHHWPFTPETASAGRIRPDRVLEALDRSGAASVALVLEVIPPFEADDDLVVRDMASSAAVWRDALAHHRGT